MERYGALDAQRYRVNRIIITANINAVWIFSGRNLNERSAAMDVTTLSSRYQVRRMSPADISQMYALCAGNPRYYQYCPPLVTEDSLRHDLKALPPGKTGADKYYVGYFDGPRLVALLDLILGFPDERTAFIGFFMMEKSLQGRGIGTAIIRELCGALAALGFSRVKLYWAEGNAPAARFWHKNGFTDTGVTWNAGLYSVNVSQRSLMVQPFGRHTAMME